MHDASGLSVKVLSHDEETGEFTLLLLEVDQPRALIERSHAGSTPGPAVFGGMQHVWDTEDWTYHVDTVDPNHQWSRPIVKALEQL